MFSTPYNQRIAHEVLAINSRYAGKQNDIESGDAYDTEGLLRTGGAYSAGAMSAGRRNRTTRNTEMMTSSSMPLPTNEYIPHKRSGAYQTPAQVAQFYHTGGIQGGAMSAGAMTGAGAFSGMFKNMKAATKYANSGGAMTGARKYKKKGGVMSGGMMSDDEEEMYGSGQHEEVSEKEAKKLLKKHLEVHTGHKGAFATKFWSAFGKHYKKEAKRRNIMVGGAMTGAGFFSSIWKGVKKAGSTVYSGVSKAAKTGINAAKTVVGDAYSGVKTLAGDAQQLGMKGANNLLDQQNKMVNTAIDTAAQVAPQVVQMVAENPELLMAAGKHKKGAMTGGFNMFKNVGKAAAAKYAKSGGAMTGARKYKKKGGVMSGGMMSDDEEEMYGSGQHEEVSEKEAKKLLKKHLEVHTGHKGAFATKFWSAFGKHYKKEAKRRNIMVGGAMTGAGFFSSIWKGVKKAGSTVYSGVSKAAKTGINAAKTVVGDAYSGVKTLAGDAQQLGMKGANNLLDQQNKMVNTAIDTAAQVAPQVVQMVAENPELLMAAGKHKKGAMTGGFNMFKNVGKAAAAKYAKSGGAMTGGNWLTHNPLSGLGGGAMTGGNWLTHNPLSGLGRRKRGGANPNTEGAYVDMSDAIPVAQVIYDTPQQSPDVFRELKPKKRSPPPPPADRTTKPKKRSPPPPPPDRTKKTGAGMSKAKIRGMKIKDIMGKHGVSLGEASKMLSKGMA